MSENSSDSLRHDAFTVGWVCALPAELAASEAMLDEVYPDLKQAEGDENIYTLGRIGQHKIVIACLSAGSTGIVSAAKVATDMLRSFRQIRFGLMVGIGGGAPSANEDIRLGDVVVGVPDGELGGVVKFDQGKTTGGGKFEHQGSLNMPPAQVRNGVNKLRARHEAQKNLISQNVSEMIRRKSGLEQGNPQFEASFSYQGAENDQLYESSYDHENNAAQSNIFQDWFRRYGIKSCVIIAGSLAVTWNTSFLFSMIIIGAISLGLPRLTEDRTLEPHASRSKNRKLICWSCDKRRLIPREPRPTSEPVIFYGNIASADQVMRHAHTRDALRDKYKVLCFEMEAAGLMNDFPCLVIRGICDYSDSHKNKLWQRYAAATAAAYARELLEAIPPAEVTNMEAAFGVVEDLRYEIAGVHTKLKPLLFDHELSKRQKILSWLSPTNFEAEQLDIFSKYQTGTCESFLKSKQFCTWYNIMGHSLICPGIPGAGKTVFSSVVVDFLQRQCNEDSHVAYLYCMYGKQKEQTAVHLLRSVLRQFSEQSYLVPKSVSLLHKHHGTKQTRPTDDEIFATLLGVIRRLDRAFLVVDALDECSEETYLDLLKELRKLQDSTKLNLIATSRKSMEQDFWNPLVLEIRAQGMDIDRYLDARLRNLSSYVNRDNELKREIKAQIIQAADGMFLLATLHFDSLKDKKTKNEFRHALKDLPRGSLALHLAYDNAMYRINQQRDNNRRWAQRVLAWVVHALRPLKPDELRHALAVRDGDSDIEEDNIPILSEVISLCAGLVVVNQDSNTVQLVHQTTYEYFSHYQTDWARTTRDIVASTCTTYLLFDTFKAGYCRKPSQFDLRVEKNPLYSYAASNWGRHVRLSTLEESQLVLTFLENEGNVSACAQALIIHGGQSHGFYGWPQRVCGIHLAAFFGLQKTVQVLLDTKQETDCLDSYGQTPLCWAARGKQLEIARFLLDRGASIDLASQTTDPLRSIYIGPATPTGWAVRTMDLEMVKLLLDCGANPEPCQEGDYPSLFMAIQAHNTEIAKLLLDHSANPNLGRYDHYPLWWAAQWADITMATLLLEHGARPDLCPKDRSSSLWWAARRSNIEMVRLLLEYQADPNLCSLDRSSPLWWAAGASNIEIVKLLLQNGADPNLCHKDGSSPLWWAARENNIEIVKILFEHHAEPNHRREHRHGALWWAKEKHKNEEMFALLLDHGEVLSRAEQSQQHSFLMD